MSFVRSLTRSALLGAEPIHAVTWKIDVGPNACEWETVFEPPLSGPLLTFFVRWEPTPALVGTYKVLASGLKVFATALSRANITLSLTYTPNSGGDQNNIRESSTNQMIPYIRRYLQREEVLKFVLDDTLGKQLIQVSRQTPRFV